MKNRAVDILSGDSHMDPDLDTGDDDRQLFLVAVEEPTLEPFLVDAKHYMQRQGRLIKESGFPAISSVPPNHSWSVTVLSPVGIY